MFQSEKITSVSKPEFYSLLVKQVQALLQNEQDSIANMANLAALLFDSLVDINWAGFYRLVDGELLLGPFMGKSACVHIQIGKGVCGTSAQKQQTLRVEDVHKFPGHIACDAASQSEIVIPLVKNNILYGVLDIDSPIKNRFDAQDQAGLEKIVEIFLQQTSF